MHAVALPLEPHVFQNFAVKSARANGRLGGAARGSRTRHCIMPVNYLNVAKEQDKKEEKENKKEKKPPSTEHLQKGFKTNELRLQQIAAEERARREAGISGAKELAVRLADHMPMKTKKDLPMEQQQGRPSEREVPPTPADDKDARFRAELQKQPLENLKRFCNEIGVAANGNKAAIVERLAAHAREHHAHMQQQQQQQQAQRQQTQTQDSRPPTGASSSSRAAADARGSRPPTGASSSSRAAADAAARPTSGLSVASLSLEEQRKLLDELTEKAQARPGTSQSTATSFAAASTFGGAKAGAVFKRDARGLGYYRDA